MGAPPCTSTTASRPSLWGRWARQDHPTGGRWGTATWHARGWQVRGCKGVWGVCAWLGSCVCLSTHVDVHTYVSEVPRSVCCGFEARMFDSHRRKLSGRHFSTCCPRLPVCPIAPLLPSPHAALYRLLALIHSVALPTQTPLCLCSPKSSHRLTLFLTHCCPQE